MTIIRGIRAIDHNADDSDDADDHDLVALPEHWLCVIPFLRSLHIFLKETEPQEMRDFAKGHKENWSPTVIHYSMHFNL